MPNYKHFFNMTDEVGFLQFSQHHQPDPDAEGLCNGIMHN